MCLKLKASSDLDSPRLRFNWGYHDAAGESRRGTVRRLVETGEHNTQQVSKQYDLHYWEAYQAGLQAVESGEYANDSSLAWRRYVNSLDSLEQDKLFEAILDAEIAGLAKCLRCNVDIYILARASKYAHIAMWHH